MDTYTSSNSRRIGIRQSNATLKDLNRFGGFSLVELLIAMTIGLVVLSGVISVFAGNKRNTDLNAAMANIQESARFALNTIAADVRMAGYQGCIDVNRLSVRSRTNNAPVVSNRLNSTATTGALITDSGTLDPVLPFGYTPPDTRAAIPGTHLLMLQFGDAANEVGLTGRMEMGGVPSLAGPLLLDDDIEGLAVNDLAIVANCEAGDLFQVTALGAGNVALTHSASGGANRSGNLQQVYGNDLTIDQTRVMKFQSHIYYIGETGEQNTDGSDITALYQQGLPYASDNLPTELVQGVENMRVTFGLRDNSGNLRYVTPDDASFNPRLVESVQIGLLMSSWESIADEDDTNTYLLAGQPIAPASDSPGADINTHPGDKRFRLAFNTTIKVRNRRNRQ